MIPYVKGGKQKILSMYPYNAITLRMPGRHASDTTPVGGDFVVCVDDESMDWVEHQFTHTDLFNDLQLKMGVEGLNFMEDYLKVVRDGVDPEKIETTIYENMAGIHPQTFLYAVQCLAVAEHRRYAQFESKFGGRYLPFRFGAGIVEGLWTATEAADKQKKGRPGVEWLEKDFGVPALTKELMS
jgi:hypothetical protein